MPKSETEQLISNIKKNITQISINKIDEVEVMKCMLNDKDFTVGVYDKSHGYIGQRSPHDEGVRFLKNVIADATGLERKDAQHLAENYEWQKRDANFLLTNMRDYLNTYLHSGRKINLLQTSDSEANVYIKDMNAGQKSVPDKDNPGKAKIVKTKAYTKLVSQTKCPTYKEDK